MKDGADREMEKETKRKQKKSVTATLEGFGYSTNPSVRNSPEKAMRRASLNDAKTLSRAGGGSGAAGGGGGSNGGVPGEVETMLPQDTTGCLHSEKRWHELLCKRKGLVMYVMYFSISK